MATAATEIPGAQMIVRANSDLNRIARIGQWLAASESGSNDANSRGAAAALRLVYAEALGLPPMAASELSVIKGRLIVSAKLVRALGARHGYRVRRSEDSDDKKCTAILIDTETGEEVDRYTFTMEMAETAKLVRPNSAWETHPGRMLWARASKFILDDNVPHVTLGLSTEDEAAEIQQRPAELASDDEVEEAEFEPIQTSAEPRAEEPGDGASLASDPHREDGSSAGSADASPWEHLQARLVEHGIARDASFQATARKIVPEGDPADITAEQAEQIWRAVRPQDAQDTLC